MTTKYLERLVEDEEARAETGGPDVLTADDVRAALKADMARLGLNRMEWGERKGFSATFVGAVLLGNKEPSEKLCDALGIERRMQVTYVRRVKV